MLPMYFHLTPFKLSPNDSHHLCTCHKNLSIYDSVTFTLIEQLPSHKSFSILLNVLITYLSIRRQCPISYSLLLHPATCCPSYIIVIYFFDHMRSVFPFHSLYLQFSMTDLLAYVYILSDMW